MSGSGFERRITRDGTLGYGSCVNATTAERRRVESTDSTSFGTGHEFVDPRVPLEQKAPIRFIFFWTAAGRCEGRDFQGLHRAGSITRTLAMIELKRVYEKPSTKDGLRVLVDRLWPRGLTKERAAVDLWIKDVAPSTELRQWFGHDPVKWKEFQVRYRQELNEKRDCLKELKQKSKSHTVTLLYGARDEEHNEALVLKKILDGPER
jgi:uncharacterized protein YeaO (DUF488 family)